ncbi:pentapeptide repeat-containing protein [Rhodococcus sp. BP-149]|uniref:pentapeptide repeat-containing protein n=1 Tax=unclassified Rhodococcus (in: high G+C Gram-positive bacteria) TaxID=192944 RepID=UPI001C9B404F|nr:MULTISPECIES: pentapeptide repeat-containing protein [unclassified Rhodococcus (in: high G+C Gram-positive bacteria)]MBY6687473.1 pentapeptide repeat-containing protein [Rhodococcus sp. BP-288]MBY6696432.1 pentapeptide repeat-containing protein [Rhodococcus sp. BP-188]MBY6700564.1 pentapeptide repeat-containing protein [Rhodococcus sp. BP-285]MBY6704413.1 pentapeptide repeat-containing protein [Rhodococcus sp. BP-283]MBY6713689.1 pentapeptide repeat-containing protein [Rhodococcus sp. BP-16
MSEPPSAIPTTADATGGHRSDRSAARHIFTWGSIGAGTAGGILGVGALVLSTPIAPGQGTVLGGLGVLAAAGLTYYASHRTRVSNERIEDEKTRQAGRELAQTQEHFAAQQRSETERADTAHRAATTRELRSRFTAAATQLADASPTIRLAGVYSLIALADDWFAHGNPSEREVCVALLLSYLRAPQVDPEPDDDGAQPHLFVRETIVRQVAKRVSEVETDASKEWRSIESVAFTRADLRRVDLRGAALSGHDLSHASMDRCRLSYTDLSGCNLTSSFVRNAQLVGTNLTSARLRGARFGGSSLRKATLDRVHAPLAFFSEADMTGATFTDAYFVLATFRGTTFDGAEMSGANFGSARGLDSASLEQISYDPATRWPKGFSPPLSSPRVEEQTD